MDINSTAVTPIKKEDSPEDASILSYLVGLNDQQLAAATAPVEGATRILGSPGERSVEVLVARITHLVRHHELDPSKIVVLTFSNEAAQDILTGLQLDSNLGVNEANLLIIGTFHDICSDYLVRHGSQVSVSTGFRLEGPSGSIARVENLSQYRMARPTNRLTAGQIIEAISYAKNKGLSPDRVKGERLGRFTLSERRVIADVWSAYEEQMELHNVLDFDNHLIKGAELFALPLFAESFASVLVDSFHNTTALGYKVAQALARHSQSITVVGSHDLSIFDWKSANDGQFKKVIEDFNPHRTYSLEQNYTTSHSILEMANMVIKQDSSRIRKTLASQLPRGPPVVLHHALDADEEAEFFANTITSLREQLDGLVDYKDFAVLVRQNHMLVPVKNALSVAQIPFSSEVGTDDVLVSTIHSAAGLNRAIVFVPGVEQGTFPHHSTTNYNEERRVLFVAMTRARTHLILSYAKSREGYSGRRSCKTLSPFINKQMFASKLPMVTDYMRRDVETILGRDWRPKSVKVEEEKAVATLSPLRSQAISSTPKREISDNAPLTPPRNKRVKLEEEESPTSRR